MHKARALHLLYSQYSPIRTFSLVCFLLLFALKSDFQIQAQNELNITEKYVQLRNQLKRDFLVVGKGKGHSLPARIVNPDFKRWSNISQPKKEKSGMIRWGDATIFLGDYLAVLATELALLKQYNKPNKSTLKEIYFALLAVERLDSLAEHHLYGVPASNSTFQANGFLVRDDIDEEFVKSNFERSSFHSSMAFADPPKLNVISQDQLIGLIFGCRFIVKACNEETSFKNVSLQKKAQLISHRLLDYLQHLNWILKDPVKHKNVPRGSNALYQSFPLAKTGKKITNTRYGDWWSSTIGLLAWKYIQHPFSKFAGKKQPFLFDDVNNAMMLRLAATSGTWRKKRMTANSIAARTEVYALASSYLNNYKELIPEQHIKDILESLPDKGPYAFSPTDFAKGGWASLDRWNHPNYMNSGVDKREHTAGLYSGIDYMLLFNLYHIVYQVAPQGWNK